MNIDCFISNRQKQIQLEELMISSIGTGLGHDSHTTNSDTFLKTLQKAKTFLIYLSQFYCGLNYLWVRYEIND